MKIKSIKCFCAGIFLASLVSVNIVNASEIDLRRFKKYSSSDLVKVIVTVNGEPVLSSSKAAKDGVQDYLKTTDAEQKESKLETYQQKAESYIKSFYPELKIKYSYNALVNGFACEIPQEIIDDVKACPYVKRVEKSGVSSKPNLVNAISATGADIYSNNTECKGAGESVAVLDTELDISHEMFSPIAEEKAEFSKEDIVNYIKSNKLNAELDADKVYVSTKLPLVYSYTNYDDHYDVSDSGNYHGTHVCGIAAGNEETYKGKKISGTAPDAQIIFMDVFSYSKETNSYYADDFDVIAAMEDAVKLGVTAINLSLGSDREDYSLTAYNEACANAENAGIMVCAAAGNFGVSGTSPKEPDTSTLSYPASNSSVTAVASANQNYQMYYYLNITGDTTKIPYSDCSSQNYFSANKTVKYVYCKGNDFTNENVKGKIILCDLDKDLKSTAKAAEKAGAKGLIVIAENDLLPIFPEANKIPCIMIRKSDGEKLIKADKKEFVMHPKSEVSLAFPLQISDFSGKGVSESLEIKPDITAVGCSVISAAPNNNYEYQQGTSMATPFITGCMLLTSENMKKNNVKLEGRQKALYVKNILMNSAKLLTDLNTEMPYSPRLQGAGFVDMVSSLNDKVVLTGNDGRAKINLFDNLSANIDFNINAENLSSENVNFTNAELNLYTDGWAYDSYQNELCISKTIQLKCSSDLSALKSLNPKEHKSLNISAVLDNAQLEKIKSVYTNGFFIEGYITLSGAENCCDISIPILGFYGDWADVPIFYNDENGIMSNIPVSYLFNSLWLLGRNWENDTISKDKYYISPNGDGILDSIGFSMNNLRESVNSGIRIFDKNGNKVSDTADIYANQDFAKNQNNEQISAYVLPKLKEGEFYTAELYGQINYKGSENHIQTKSVKFRADYTPPKIISSKVIKKDGRKILEIKVKDNEYLKGIAIIGKGKGFKVGYEEYAKNQISTLRSFVESYIDSGAYDIKNTDNSKGKKITVNKLLSVKSYKDIDKLGIDFADLQPIDVSKGEEFTLQYDITNLTNYDFVAVDYALNYSETNDVSKPSDGHTKPNKPSKPNNDNNNNNHNNKPSHTPNSNQPNKNDNSIKPNPSTGNVKSLAVTALTFGFVIISSRRKKKSK